MRIYLDVCCLCRPFDLQLNDEVKLEREAILILLSRVENQLLTLVTSDTIEFETGKIDDNEKKLNIKLILSLASNKIIIDRKINERAKYFETKGIKSFDALHLACAEEGSDLLFTVDKKFFNLARQIKDLKIPVNNPVEYLLKEYYQ
jgi:hypothetical protein